ncbi:Alpha/Beta hydrolase protein [Globomyces pollinis-pini]|nr:Alpha/Beta hydrolase protein [Globomyces pollinis-pini]
MQYSTLFSVISLLSSTNAIPAQTKATISTNAQDNFPLFMQYSGAAYCDKLFSSSAPAFNCGARCGGDASGTILTRSINNKETEGAGFVGYNTNLNLIIVSVRGSANAKNWANNIQLWTSTVDDWGKVTPALLEENNRDFPSDAKVHAGFEKTYLSIRTDLQRAVQSLSVKYPTYKIVFTGHSLGGALATMAAADFVENFGGSFADRISLYTYGQPRVGNREWANYIQSTPFASRMYRIQRRGDLVVQIPYQWMGFYHSGSQYTLLEDNKTIRVCKVSGPAGESNDCLNDDGGILGTSVHTQYYNYNSNPCA